MAVNVFNPASTPFPHLTIHFATILIIEEGIRKAWELLRGAQIHGFDLTSAKEDEITQQLRLIVYNRVLKNKMVDGFTLDLFRIGREAKYENYNGDNIEKMPDLVVEIIGRNDVERPSDDGLFIECKPVDNKHPVGRTYCGDGLIRFVDGSYAWTMTQAMMIGYVCEGYSILPKLSKALRSQESKRPPKRINTLQYPSPSPDTGAQVNTWCESVHITSHRRFFSYVQTNTQAPEIVIRHLWLRRD